MKVLLSLIKLSYEITHWLFIPGWAILPQLWFSLNFNILLMLYSMQDGSLVVDCLKLADNTADLLTIKRRRCLDFAANLMKAPQNNKVNRTTNC